MTKSQYYALIVTFGQTAQNSAPCTPVSSAVLPKEKTSISKQPLEDPKWKTQNITCMLSQ